MGGRNFGLDYLKSILNRDMEEKGIVLRELSCRTAAELPAQELSDFRLASAPGVHVPERPESFGGGRTASTAAGLPPKLRQPGSPEAPLREYNLYPPYLLLRQLRQGKLGGSPAEKGIVLPELSCRASVEFPPPELLVRWSAKS